jgi:hypothetical protein
LENIIPILKDSVPILSVVLGIFYLYKCKYFDKTYRVFSVYLFLIGIIQFSSYIIGRGYFNKPNLFLSHFYFIIQFILLSLFYSQLLKYKVIKTITIIGLIGFGIQYLINPKLFFAFNSIGMAISHFILVCYAMLYLFKNLGEKSDYLIINIGLFFYLLSSTLIFASSSLILHFKYYFVLLNINVILYFIFQLLLLYVWFTQFRKIKG